MYGIRDFLQPVTVFPRKCLYSLLHCDGIFIGRMQELHNTEDFKETLRACLLAGFMRGCQDRWELTDDFKAACKEEINCPRLLSLFDYEPAVLQNMRQQIEFSSDNALEYYISHLLYISKQRG